jgi:hypothetical protein
LAKDVSKSYREKLELFKFSSVSVEAAFTKRYHNSLLSLMKLSRSERILLDFITEEMDDHNFITNSKQNRDKFNKLLKKIGQETYSDTTIHRCFANLAKHDLISNCKGRGLYQVSPVFFFRGSEEERTKVLREILERINKQPINKIRHDLLKGIKVSSSPEREAD